MTAWPVSFYYECVAMVKFTIGVKSASSCNYAYVTARLDFTILSVNFGIDTLGSFNKPLFLFSSHALEVVSLALTRTAAVEKVEDALKT